MYAIIETGGKQFKVEEGLELDVALMAAEPGAEVEIDKVLMIGQGSDVKIGTPYVDSAKVNCEVVGHGRGKKIIVFKKWNRNDSQKKQGHRQDYTKLKVKSITA